MSEIEQTDDEKRMQEAFREARDAQQLLHNPKIQGFLQGERQAAWDQFKAMPATASPSEYMEIKLKIQVLDEFERTLSQYVRYWEDMETRKEWKDTIEE